MTSVEEVVNRAMSLASEIAASGEPYGAGKYVEHVVQLVEVSGKSRSLLKQAAEVCMKKLDEGEDAAGLAAKLLDEAQSSNLAED